MSHAISPILRLKTAIAAAPFRIAPEREAELADWIQKAGSVLDISSDPGFRFSVGTESKTIRTSVATLEYLWASAYAHHILYNEYAIAQRAGAEKFDLDSNPRRRNAVGVLDWATGKLLERTDSSWPIGLPYPTDSPTRGSDVHVANELFLSGLAWIFHHELAHLRLGHSGFDTAVTIDEERSADLSATRFILEECVHPDEYRKRSLGVAVGILALQAIERDDHAAPLRTHPRSFERLDYCLLEADLSEDDEIYAFCLCVMQIQLAVSGKSIAHDGRSFREVYDSYLLEFARR